MKIELTTMINSSKQVFTEEYNIADGSDYQQLASDLIDNFNNTLRPNESPRTLMSVRVVQ